MWLGRFQVIATSDENISFRDRLNPNGRVLPVADFARLPEAELQREYLRRGFMSAALPVASAVLTGAPRHVDDAFFWQFPCRTEAAAFALHAALAEAPFDGRAVHVYLGLPWATWIDRQRVDPERRQTRREIAMQRVRLAGFRHALREVGVDLRVHTVCQHVYWRELLGTWRELGVSDAWLSHAPAAGDVGAAIGDLVLHPWRLFAVNVEDPHRRAGLRIGVDPADKPLLASFIGTHAPHYLSDVRLRLKGFAAEPGFHIELTERWHFEDVVYRHQVYLDPLEASYRVDQTVDHYNRVLSDSVFSLCPAGAGANTLRLWESLAVGSVPVLLGPLPMMPRGGSLPPIDWDEIVLRIADHQVAELPLLLRSMPIDEVRRRQRLGLQAFAQVQEQSCF